MRMRRSTAIVSTLIGSAAFLTPAAFADNFFVPNDLVVSSSTYDGTASTVTVGQALPGGGTAITNGTFPSVFDNSKPDGSFSVATPFTLLQYSIGGTESTPALSGAGSLPIPTSVGVNSFSSKSEGALNLSTGGSFLTVNGYSAADDALDESNSNTPGIIDSVSANPDTAPPVYRNVISIGASGTATSTSANMFAGDNVRASVDIGNGQFIAVGNSSDGTTQAIASAGAQVGSYSSSPITPSQIGPFTVGQTNPATGLPYATGATLTADKIAKDDNFRGLTDYNNAIYLTKGSGSNGIDTVYYIGNSAGQTLTPSAIAASPSSAKINVLPGFPTSVNRNPTTPTGYFPFGIWFANPTTLYVADEGDGVYSDAVGGLQTNAGLEKWTFNSGTGQWVQDYTLQAGLIGHTYNAGAFPYLLTAGGLRNITGKVNSDGTVTIYGVTAALANLPTTGNDKNFDQGASPDQLVAITDTLADTSLSQASGESFDTLETSNDGQVFRGVSFAPVAVPEPATLTLLAGGSAFTLLRRRRKQA
jgi:hypothetical protein